MGGPTDRSAGSSYHPSWFTPFYLETIYHESWACARAIDLIVDDLFQRRPEFENMKDDGVMRIREECDRFMLYDKLMAVMRMARLHGTGLLAVITRDRAPDMPLEDGMVMPNDLVNLVPVDRWSASVWDWQDDIMRPNFGEAEMYRITPRRSSSRTLDLRIHRSRIIRFDGIRPVALHSWYDPDWGTSELSRILKAVTDEEQAATGGVQLMQEASIPVVKSQGFTDAMRTGNFSPLENPDEVSTDEIAQQMQRLLSIYRILFIDKEGDFSRVNVTFSGIPELLDRYSKRIAAAVGIPVTRFLGESPVGLQSTGDGEARNYAMLVMARQENMLRPTLKRLFHIIARNVGVMEVPDYHFPSLVDVSDLDRANTAKSWCDAVGALLGARVIDENEAREMLRMAFPEARHLEDLTDADLQALRENPIEDAQIEALRARANGNGNGNAGGE